MNAFELTNQAVEEVEKNNQSHATTIYEFAINWVKKQMKPFTVDDLKNDYYEAGNPPPAQPAVFGAPFRKLSSKHLIFDTERTVKSKRKESHQRPLRVWISREYSLIQQANASQQHQHQISIFN